MIKLKKTLLILPLTVLLAGGVFLWSKNFKEKTFASHQAIKKELAKENAKLTQNVFPVEEKKPAKILFLGDLMFDRYIRQVSEKKGNEFVFEKVRNLLSKNDLVVANLEGPITDNASKSVNTEIGGKNHLVFTFDKSLAGTLLGENIKLVNIGNNHILNFGASGMEETKENLAQNKIEYFGDADTIVKNVNGVKIGFVNYNQFSSCRDAFHRDAINCVSTTVENIKNLKNQADFVAVYTHWGVEYNTGISESTRSIAHDFIDSGADLIIGSHPHVIEGKEEYKGKTIYYSLGNFIFDQYFSEDTKKGLAVEVKIDPQSRKTEFRDINLTLKSNGQTLADGL